MARAVGIAVVRCLAVDWQQLKWTAIFTIIFFSFFPHSPLRPFLKEGVLRSKNYFAKVDQSAQYPRNQTLSRPRRPFCGPLAAILDFVVGSMFLIEGVLGSKNFYRKS